MRKSTILGRDGSPIVILDTTVVDADGINAGWTAFTHSFQVGWVGTLEVAIVNLSGVVVLNDG